MIKDELIQSPCIRNCCLNEDDVCLGCFRALTEIIDWSDSDNTRRITVLEKAKKRRLAYHKSKV
ncbi:MAG: DUF1289 domain-containing protein [Methylococcaceae bacterium]|nr:DUF1289 domain-containing protein [Methylococcaceae bacterium]